MVQQLCCRSVMRPRRLQKSVLVPSPERSSVNRRALHRYDEIRFDFNAKATRINQ
nr:MAG TPA: hypothetical protein [Caudoviricetes sp.]